MVQLGGSELLGSTFLAQVTEACSLPDINIWKVFLSTGARQVCAMLCRRVSSSWGGFCSPALLLSKGAVAEA